MNELTQLPFKLEFELSVKLFSKFPHPNPTSTHTQHRTFSGPFSGTNAQINIFEKLCFENHRQSLGFNDTICGMKKS